MPLRVITLALMTLEKSCEHKVVSVRLTTCHGLEFPLAFALRYSLQEGKKPRRVYTETNNTLSIRGYKICESRSPRCDAHQSTGGITHLEASRSSFASASIFCVCIAVTVSHRAAN